MAKYLNEMGLALYDAKIKERLAKKADADAVPAKVSELDNDAGYLTAADVPAVPAKVSELDNDAGYLTAADVPAVPAKVSELENDAGYLTAADVPAVPAKVSELDNDAGYLTADDVPTWAKAADKPAYTAAEVGAIPAEQADQFARKSDLASVYRYKGSVAGLADLPAEGNEAGDVWNVEATDMNYGWTGSAWDPLGQIFEIEAITSAEIDAIVNG